MTAKSLFEAFAQGLGKHSDILETNCLALRRCLLSEIKAFQANELRQLQADLNKEGNSPQYREIAEQVLNRYFDRVFRDLSHINTSRSHQNEHEKGN